LTTYWKFFEFSGRKLELNQKLLKFLEEIELPGRKLELLESF